MPFTPPATYRSLAQTGYLATFSIGAIASPQTYTAIIDLRSIKTNDMTIPEVNTTHLLSPAATEEFIPGLIKPGNIEITGNFVGDASQQLIPNFATGGGTAPALFAFKLVAPTQQNSATYTATGLCYVSKWEVGPFETNKSNDISVGFQISGAVAYSYS